MTKAPAVNEARELASRARENVQRVIVDKDEAINLALVAPLCRGHIPVEDVPGVGKTTLAKALVPAELPHRMIISSTARLRGSSAEQEFNDVLSTVAVPIGI